MLGPDHEASSSTVAAKKASPSVDTAAIDVPATPASSKTPRLRLKITSHRSSTSFLRLNESKSSAKQRSKSVTDFTLTLIQSSSTISSQLPKTLDSIPPSELSNS